MFPVIGQFVECAKEWVAVGLIAGGCIALGIVMWAACKEEEEERGEDD